MTVKLRFAPSPTGYLHVGNIRTALMNGLLCRQQNGHFMLRLDDTDLERSKPEYIDAVREDLAWLGLSVVKNFPIGGITDMLSPMRMLSLAYVENLPPSTFLMATLCSPSKGLTHSE